MSGIDWAVIAAGVAVIVGVYWYFFRAERSSASAAVNAAGRQEVLVTVRGGYDPATIHVRAGAPVRLLFDRRETSGCSEEVVFPDFGLRRFLPPFERTAVEFTPPAPGTYEFTCGMSMLHGQVVAE